MMSQDSVSRPNAEVTAVTPTSVYRYYDSRGFLLYVGITSRGIIRNDEHNHKEWWQFVTRQEVEHFPSRPQALAREKKLIRKHNPPFNKVHNPGHEGLRAAYFRLSTGDRKVSPLLAILRDPVTIYKNLDKKLPLWVSEIDRDNRLITLATDPKHRTLAKLLKLNPSGKQRVPVSGTFSRIGWIQSIKLTDANVFVVVKSDGPAPLLDGGVADLQFKTGVERAVFIKRIVMQTPRVSGGDD